VGSFCYLFDVIKTRLQGFKGIFGSDEPLAEIYGILRKGASFLSSFGTLVYCRVIARA
jgi:hypothetical protein